jgi:hypothetical protein
MRSANKEPFAFSCGEHRQIRTIYLFPGESTPWSADAGDIPAVTSRIQACERGALAR